MVAAPIAGDDLIHDAAAHADKIVFCLLAKERQFGTVYWILIDAEKGHGLPLVAVVKPGNKSEMVARLTRYGFRPFSNAPVNFAYRWDPERRGTA